MSLRFYADKYNHMSLKAEVKLCGGIRGLNEGKEGEGYEGMSLAYNRNKNKRII